MPVLASQVHRGDPQLTVCIYLDSRNIKERTHHSLLAVLSCKVLLEQRTGEGALS